MRMENWTLNMPSDIRKQITQSAWPMTTPTGRLVGVGGMSNTFQSATMLTIKTQEGTTCTVHPYIASIPISLMGWDVMGQCKFTIYSPENLCQGSTGPGSKGASISWTSVSWCRGSLWPWGCWRGQEPPLSQKLWCLPRGWGCGEHAQSPAAVMSMPRALQQPVERQT